MHQLSASQRAEGQTDQVLTRLLRRGLIVGLLIGGDQLTKWAVRTAFSPSETLPVIPSVLHLTYVQNTGAAFGLFPGYPQAFVVLAVLVAGWIIVELTRMRPRTWPVETGLLVILGGSLGNLIDRLRFGYVVDFIDLRVWPVFNLADSAITVGVGLLLWQAFRRR